MRSHFGILAYCLLYYYTLRLFFYKISTMGLLNSNVKGDGKWNF